MKTQTIILTLMALVLGVPSHAQNEREAIAQACMNYIEGFYEGDQAKLRECLQPELTKFGFWKNNDGEYSDAIHMSFDEALAYADNVKTKQEFPDADAPKEVEVLDMKEFIAVARVTAWWGVDYLLLSKRSGTWMIEQVIWQGPNSNN